MNKKTKQLLKTEPLNKLQVELADATQLLVKARLDLKTNQLKNTSQIGMLKNKIAVLKTLIHSKASAEVEAKPTKN